MPKIFRTFTTEEWLKLKSKDVSSTESPALIGLSPYATIYELYYRKKTQDLVQIEDNERMKWGRRFEDVIAKGVGEDMGLKVRRMKAYMRHDKEPGMGSSFDYEIMGHKDGMGIMEIKNVDGLVFRDHWSEEEAPPHIEIQVQHQMEVANRNWCLIVALVGGNQPVIIRRERNKKIGEGLRKKIKQFWKDIKIDNAPAPDFSRDAEFIINLHQAAGLNVLEAQGNEVLTEIILQYKKLASAYSKLDKLKDAKKAEILDVIGDQYQKVMAGKGLSLSCGMSKESPKIVITKEMIGEEYGGRKSYRTFRVYQKKEKP